MFRYKTYKGAGSHGLTAEIKLLFQTWPEMAPTLEFPRNIHPAPVKKRTDLVRFFYLIHVNIKGEFMLKLPTILFLISLVVLTTIHLTALNFFLYWHFPSLDIFVHGFAGATLALGIFTVADFWRHCPSWWLDFFPVVTFVLLVGLAWEWFELWAGLPVEDDFLIDFTIDLVMDIVGGAGGFAVGRAVKQI